MTAAVASQALKGMDESVYPGWREGLEKNLDLIEKLVRKARHIATGEGKVVDADDVRSDLGLYMVKRARQYDPQGDKSLRDYLFRGGSNRVRKIVRNTSTRLSLDELMHPHDPDEGERETSYWAGEPTYEVDVLGNMAVREAVENLPDAERFVIEEKFWGDKTIVEIAADLGRSKSQVGRLLQQALQALQKALS